MGNFSLERQCHSNGYALVAGLDEVGRGCLAGPVVAGAVIFADNKFPKGIRDSKEISAKERERLAIEIKEMAIAYAIGLAEVTEIDAINILNASKLAMVRAVQALPVAPQMLLIDGNFQIPYPLPQKTVVKGDKKSFSIGAAAIIAKVFRDNLMKDFDERYPGYLFSQNKGYGSEEHRRALQKIGPCIIHRKSFSWTPVAEPSPVG